MNWAILIQLLIAVGFFELVREAARRIWNRKRASIDAAAVIQGMSLQLLEPLHAELAAANATAVQLREKLHVLEGEFDALLVWARHALMLLEQHHLEIAPIPARVRRGG